MQDSLRRGYEILLGRPLSSFDPAARYEVWFWADAELLPETARVPSLGLEQLVVGKPMGPAAKHDDVTAAEFWTRYAVDYARSLFVYDKHDVPDAPPPLVAALQTHQYALTGEQLAEIVEREELPLGEVLELCWYACRRVVSDGSLLDAMAAATLSASAPDGLLSRWLHGDAADKIRFEPRWEHALRVIEDETVREHLLMSCVDLATARWAGSWIDPRHKADVWLEPLTRRGGEILAIWHAGEAQATRAVVQLSPSAVPVAATLSSNDSTALPIAGGDDGSG